MNTKLEIFNNEEFGQVRVVMVDSEPYFVAKDIATVLGYKDPKNTVKNRCKRCRVSEIPHPQNPNKTLDVTAIPESDIYRLIIGSKLESAQRFETWVMDEILPSIRKHGAYMTNEVIERTLADPDYLIRLATALKEERQARLLAERQIEEQKPLVEFANKVSDSSNLIDMGKMARLLKDENINIGRNRLFEWLRKKEILMKNNMPYQRYIDSNYFQVKESTYETPYGIKTQQTTYVTGKGQIYITEKLRKEWK